MPPLPAPPWVCGWKTVAIYLTQAVSYRWVARNFQLHANVAKQILFEVSEGNAKVERIFFLAGYPRGHPKRHLIRLVADGELAARQGELEVVTGLHVYSVRPADRSPPAPPSWSHDLHQLEGLLAALVSSSDAAPNSLATNGLSAVKSIGILRDPKAVSAPPAPAAGAAAASKAAAATAATQPASRASAGPTSTAAKPEPARPQVSAKAPPPAAVKNPSTSAKGGGALAAMFARAPPAKPKAEAKRPSAGQGGLLEDSDDGEGSDAHPFNMVTLS